MPTVHDMARSGLTLKNNITKNPWQTPIASAYSTKAHLWTESINGSRQTKDDGISSNVDELDMTEILYVTRSSGDLLKSQELHK